jgi:hypothetical protein
MMDMNVTDVEAFPDPEQRKRCVMPFTGTLFVVVVVVVVVVVCVYVCVYVCVFGVRL